MDDATGIAERAEAPPVGMQLPWMVLPVHPVTRYMRVRIGVVDDVVRWEVPRTLLAVVPVGVRRIQVPVAEVVSMRLRVRIRLARLLTGVTVGAVAVLAPTAWWWTALLAIVALGAVLLSVVQDLEMTTRAGAGHRAPVCFGHRIDARLFAAGVEDLRRSPKDTPAS